MSARLRHPHTRWFGYRKPLLGTECGDKSPMGHVCTLPCGHEYAGAISHYNHAAKVGWTPGPEPVAMCVGLD